MEYYRYVLAFHVLAIISWMAGILYLYRLLVHGSEQSHRHSEVKSVLQMMAFKLYKYITVPAMVASWLAGLWMTYINTGLWSMGWFWVKFIAVIAMSAATGYAGRLVRMFNQGQELPKGKKLRYLNEVPTILMIVIVYMVIVKPYF